MADHSQKWHDGTSTMFMRSKLDVKSAKDLTLTKNVLSTRKSNSKKRSSMENSGTLLLSIEVMEPKINTRNQSASLKNLENQIEKLTKEIQSRTTNGAPSSSTRQCKVVNADHETPNIPISSSKLNNLHVVSFLSDSDSQVTQSNEERKTEVLQCKLPPKEQNPKNFTLPCTIGNINFYAMADLGASVNVIPRDTSDLQTELDHTKEKLENCIIKRKKNMLFFGIIVQTVASLVGRSQSKDTLCESDTLDPLSQKLENENVELEFQVLNYAKENDHLKTTYKNLFDSINVTWAQTKTITDSLQQKLHYKIYENAKRRARLLDKVSEQKDITKGKSVNTKFANQSNERKPSLQSLRNNFVVRQKNAFQSERPKFSKTRVPPKVVEMNYLSNSVTLNLVPTTIESTVMNNERVIALRIFRINPFKAFRYLIVPFQDVDQSDVASCDEYACVDMSKITKKRPKPDKNEHEIVKNIQKPHLKIFLCPKAQQKPITIQRTVLAISE
nr:hypothetical protein [Tanacetum cinerariifolium]